MIGLQQLDEGAHDLSNVVLINATIGRVVTSVSILASSHRAIA